MQVLKVKLSLTKFTEDFWFVSFFSKFCGRSDILEVIEQNSNCFYWLIELLVDTKGLLIECVLGFFSYVCKLDTIIVVKSVDVVHDSSGVRADSGKNQQILETLVVSEIRVVKHYSLQQFNQLVW